MALDPKDQQLMETAFYNALRQWSKGGGGFGGGGSAPAAGGAATGAAAAAGGSFMGKALDKALIETGGLVQGFGGALAGMSGKLIEGGTKVSDVTGALSSSFIKAGKDGSDLAKVLGTGAQGFDVLAKYVEEGVDRFRDLSKSGAAFNNDVIAMRVSAANTRMTLTDFADVIKQNTQFMSTLGGSTTKGAERFTQFSKAFFDSGVSDNLRSMGYTTKDLNELLVTQMTTSKFRGKLEGEALAEQIRSVESLATEMDAVAKLTGKSRKEQEDLLRKQQEDGQIRAATELAVRRGGEGVRKAFAEMSVASQIGGKDFAKMQEQIFAMGRPSQDMAEKFAMAGGEAQKLMMQAAKAAKSGNDAEAKRLSEEAAIAYMRQQNSQTNLQLAAQGQKAAVEGVENSRILNDTLRKVAAENNLDLKNKDDYNKAFRMARKDVEAEQKQRKGVTDTVITAEARAADATAALNNKLVAPLNENVGPALQGFADKLKNVNFGDQGFRGSAEGKIQGFYDTIKTELQQKQDARTGQTDLLKAAKEGLVAGDKKISPDKEREFTKLAEVLKSQGQNPELVKKLEQVAAAQGKTKEDVVKEASRGSAADIKNLLSKLDVKEPAGASGAFKKYQEETSGEGRTFVGSVFNGVAKFTASTLDITGQILGLDKAIAQAIGVKRQRGSIGEAGKLIEDFGQGTLAMLHGKEGVITEEQLMSLAKGMQGSSIESVINNLINEVKSPQSDKKNPASSMFTDLINQIKSPSLAKEPNSMPIDSMVGDLINNFKSSAQKESVKAVTEPKTETIEQKPKLPGTDDASLNDVVKSLESLNMLMGQLLSQNEDIGTKQIRAVRSTGSNLFERNY